MISFNEKDLDAVAMIAPATANTNVVDVQTMIAKAHTVRSEYVHELVGDLVSSIKTGLKQASAKRKAKEQLYAMSNRELADIGITRGDIEFAVNGGVAPKTMLHKRIEAAFVAPFKALENWRSRREGYAQLMAMDARQLSDIGLTRSDVAKAIAGQMSLANDNVATANSNEGRQAS